MVSILIPCHNAERFVGEAIRSALAQSWAEKEVIVVDDGSTDGSLDVIRSFGERIRWETGPNRGGNAARNRLLDLATGEWLQYLDADDFLLPSKIEAQMRFIQEHPEVDVAYGPSVMQYEQEGAARQEILPIPEPRDPWALLALWKLPQTGSPLWRKAAVVGVGGWSADQPVCQEHELYLRLLKSGKSFAYVDDAGSVYRQWSDGTVCRRDVPNTYRHRLAITREAEDFLLEHGEMTPLRRRAFDRAYLACARIIWTFDRSWASEIMAHVEKANGGRFRPEREQVPGMYRSLYRLFGFHTAERAAAWRRQLAAR